MEQRLLGAFLFSFPLPFFLPSFYTHCWWPLQKPQFQDIFKHTHTHTYIQTSKRFLSTHTYILLTYIHILTPHISVWECPGFICKVWSLGPCGPCQFPQDLSSQWLKLHHGIPSKHLTFPGGSTSVSVRPCEHPTYDVTWLAHCMQSIVDVLSY